MKNQKFKPEKTNGTCTVCGKLFSKTAMKMHLETSKHSPMGGSGYTVPVEAKLFTILVEGSFMHEYWMYLEVPANSLLRKLDNFLRDTWVECCGHLSKFTIDGVTYFSETFEDFKEDKSMNFIMNKIPGIGSKFDYEYDFGSPTYLSLKIISERKVQDADSSIVILARNELPLMTCSTCGKTATWICRQCFFEGKGLACDDCAPEHECGEEYLLPVVNSPRVGECGYTGYD